MGGDNLTELKNLGRKCINLHKRQAVNLFLRIHKEFLEFAGLEFLLLVDSDFKWIQVDIVKGTTAKETLIRQYM